MKEEITKEEAIKDLNESLDELLTKKIIDEQHVINFSNLINTIATISDSLCYYLSDLEHISRDKDPKTRELIDKVQNRIFQIQTIIPIAENFIDRDDFVCVSNVAYFHKRLKRLVPFDFNANRGKQISAQTKDGEITTGKNLGLSPDDTVMLDDVRKGALFGLREIPLSDVNIAMLSSL